MSTHPNVILMSVFTPDGLTRKTVREICPEAEDKEYSHCLKIGGDDYSILIMEDNYNEDAQITAKEGDFVVYDLVTYGYGEHIGFDELSKKAKQLEEWSNEVSKKHNCKFVIKVGANYW